MAVPEKCPLCFSLSDNQTVITAHVYGDKNKERAFYKCNSCDISYLFPQLSKNEESKFYNSEFESFMQSRAGISGGWEKAEKHIIANQETFQRRSCYLSEFLKTKKNILEVGCSSGFMLYPLISDGHDCIGVEPSGVFNDFLTSKNIQTYQSIDNMKKDIPNQKFDMILHFFVLEHIVNPIDFLKKQIDLLNPGGKIIFEIPNVEDALYTIYDIHEFERFYWSVAHPWYFSEKSLEYVLNKIEHEYQIKLDQRYDFSNHFTWAKNGRPGGMKKYTSILGADFEEIYKNQLIKIKKCDTLVGIIHKDEEK